MDEKEAAMQGSAGKIVLQRGLILKWLRHISDMEVSDPELIVRLRQLGPDWVLAVSLLCPPWLLAPSVWLPCMFPNSCFKAAVQAGLPCLHSCLSDQGRAHGSRAFWASGPFLKVTHTISASVPLAGM